MIKDYNEMLEAVNKEVSTKPNRKYEPLTDEQKADMTEDQIKKWEDKAKEGMLFNDTELRSLSDSMRFIFESGSADKTALASFGITTSSSYGDNGKLVLDETKFRAALETNSADLQKLFTKQEDTLTGDKGGVMARLTKITDKYAGTTGATKGILIEKAGSVYAPTSILQNSLQKSMDSLDTLIDRLNKQLKTETDRYVKQFTNLETVISQMNSQSSWLSSSLGS
jgi:flagellar hook-associated protein 2